MEAAGLRLRALGLCHGHRGAFPAAHGGGGGRLHPRRPRLAGAFFSLATTGNGAAAAAAAGPVGSGAEVARAKRMLHVVLVSPLIPGNTGSIARTCAASAVGLHLVGPLGFKVDDTKLKRAGLDYWPYVVVKIHDSWDEFRDYFMKQDFSYKPGDWLVFGSETKGLPQSALEDCSREGLGGGTIRIPMVETYVRCLNLSVSVGLDNSTMNSSIISRSSRKKRKDYSLPRTFMHENTYLNFSWTISWDSLANSTCSLSSQKCEDLS
uniref:tRNA/rRNA methyltransferase SpoU type domain-containing protein n=1 Tax=Oryza meridionalis TaxID=40149 RepID=A0A0E0ENA5_9ORYZ